MVVCETRGLGMKLFLLRSLMVGVLPFSGILTPAVTPTWDAAPGVAVSPMPMGLVIPIQSFDTQHPSLNDLGGDYGPLNNDRVSLTFDRCITHDGSLASLKVAFTNLTGSFAGFWNSLINRPSYPEFALNVTNWDYLAILRPR